MKKVLILIITAFSIALLNFGLTSVSSLQLVAIAAVGIFLADWEDYAVIFTLLSGIFFDIMIHGEAGLTSLGILLGAAMYVLIKSLGLSRNVWQKAIASFVIFLVIVGVNSLLHTLLEGGGFSAGFLAYWIKQSVLHAILSLAAYWVVVILRERYTDSGQVKLS